MIATLFIPLSGRKKCWRRLAYFLNNQKIEKSQFKLVLLDTSGDEHFHTILKKWVKTCKHPNVILDKKIFTNTKQLADLTRMDYFDEVNVIMCKIYNYIKPLIEGNLLFIIEDDVIPPLDVFNKLLVNLKEDALCISGAYTLKKRKHLWVAWRDLNGSLLGQRGSGIEEIKATGFGCLLIRAKDYIQSEITWTQKKNNNDWPWGYDMEFFSKQNKKILIDWDAFCEHLEETTLINTLL